MFNVEYSGNSTKLLIPPFTDIVLVTSLKKMRYSVNYTGWSYITSSRIILLLSENNQFYSSVTVLFLICPRFRDASRNQPEWNASCSNISFFFSSTMGLDIIHVICLCQMTLSHRMNGFFSVENYSIFIK